MRWRAAVALVATALCGACGNSAPAASSPSDLSGTITVFAASSLTAVYTAIGKDFQKAHPKSMVKLSFGGSSTLVAQIQQGAIGDVFASADQPNMQKAVDAGLVAGSPSIFAHNRLEIVVGAGNPKHIAGLSDLARSELVVVLCAPAVPCGRYATQALQNAGVTVKPASQETDVKAVVSKVALGEADAGIVYVTDVKAAGAAVQGVEIPPALNVVADYPVAILKDSQNAPLAKAFVSYLLGAGQPTLARYGFTGP
ncbi:MAG: molybdate transport system substrate-binding protein [Chloroflexota bacterium]|nr:molybdate transport system substrate-binding protein [Chloroflexota bacterium]